MTNYIFPVVYIIRCKDINIKDCYIGSTIDYARRYNTHRLNTRHMNFKLYQCIRNNGGWDNWDMIVLYYCSNNRKELLDKEKEFYNMLKPTLNSQCIYLTYDEKIKKRKEYYKKTFYCNCCQESGLRSHRARHNKSNKHVLNEIKDFIYS